MEVGLLGWSGPKIEPTYRGGLGTNAAYAAAGQVPIGTGTGLVLATLTGTANQVVVTNGQGSITLSTPQDIAVGSSPSFSALNLTAGSSQLVLASLGVISWAPTTNRTLILPDVSGTVITTGNLSSITATGTIASGIWHGSVIGALYGGTGLDGSGASNGALLIGNGSGFTLATLTAGTDITLTNAAGSITIAVSAILASPGNLYNWASFS